MVIYEWKDVKYLGVITPSPDDSLPVSDPLTTHPALLSNSLHSRRPTYAQQMQSEMAAALLKTWENLSSRLMTAPPWNKQASGLPVLLLTRPMAHQVHLVSGTTLRATLLYLMMMLMRIRRRGGHETCTTFLGKRITP